MMVGSLKQEQLKKARILTASSIPSLPFFSAAIPALLIILEPSTSTPAGTPLIVHILAQIFPGNKQTSIVSRHRSLEELDGTVQQ